MIYGAVSVTARFKAEKYQKQQKEERKKNMHKTVQMPNHSHCYLFRIFLTVDCDSRWYTYNLLSFVLSTAPSFHSNSPEYRVKFVKHLKMFKIKIISFCYSSIWQPRIANTGIKCHAQNNTIVLMMGFTFHFSCLLYEYDKIGWFGREFVILLSFDDCLGDYEHKWHSDKCSIKCISIMQLTQ